MDEIEYGVFWKCDDNDKWNGYYTWSSSYEDAYYHFKQALDDLRCKAVKIVEKDITYFDVEVKEKRKMSEAEMKAYIKLICGECHAFRNEFGNIIPIDEGQLNILPVSEGGGNEPKNLMTLCVECNKERHRKD